MDDKDINQEKQENSYPSDCDNLEFKVQKIHFFPEDVEKMKNMDISERIEYKRKLKKEQRYTVEFSDDEE